MRSHPANHAWRRTTWLPALALLALVSACAPGAGPGGVSYDAPAFERRIVTNIEFGFDSDRIRPDSYPLLDNAAVALNDPQLAGLRFEINGHTDLIGRLGYNIGLSALRANAVVEYLSLRGVPRERMRAQGFGPLQPLEGQSPASPLNRRVEIVALR